MSEANDKKGFDHGDGGCVVFFLVIVILLVGFSAYNAREITLPPERVDNIVRVFMHEPGNYSFLVQNENRELVSYAPKYSGVARIVTDVPHDKNMWAILKKSHSFGSDNITSIEIHIHSPEDIEGGGWNHGKFGKGRTKVVQ